MKVNQPSTLRERIIEALDHFNDLDYYNNYTHAVAQEMADVLQEALDAMDALDDIS